MNPFPGSAAHVVDASAHWCSLISKSSWRELDALLDADFTYRHSTGTLDCKTAWIARLQGRSRTIAACNASARLFGPIAVLSAEHIVTFTQADATPNVVRLDVLQVWSASADRWKLTAHYSALSAVGK